ncbi:MAG TPA: zinc ribbon domain-containing protein [Candidatus Dormibacteraeota bacterium]|nr:zinc ribbon domain-containing protein [Candidatus Dormibacteraeota bacterium]
MPIYDYICSNCKHRTEVIHGINDAGPRFCPNCGAEGTLTKAFSTPAVHFKGSGWAKKDRSSASSARTKAANAASSSDGAGSGGDATRADKGSAGASSGADAGASSSTDTAKPAASSED